MKSLSLVLALGLSSAAMASNTVVDETLFLNFQQSIQSKNKSMSRPMAGLSSYEQKIFVDALEALALDNSAEAMNTLSTVDTFAFAPLEELRVAILRIKYNKETVIPEALVNELSTMVLDQAVDVRVIYTIAAYEDLLGKAGAGNLVELAKRHPQYSDVADNHDFKETLTEDMFSDLVYKTPDVSNYMNGEYVTSVKIFKFCRENRLYPCLMIMKDIHGQLVREANGKLWVHQSLSSSKYGLPSYASNGQTPTGIYTIDSVMPVADQGTSFGKFRRMVLNFIPKSKDEVLFKTLLPDSSKAKDWWQESRVARDNGRNYFRIHGSGKINPDPTTPYFPFNRTSGCIAQRENTYGDVTYKDQRDLLDKIMTEMDLVPSYANEVKVKGIIYLSEIPDATQGPVTLEDLNKLGIE